MAIKRKPKQLERERTVADMAKKRIRHQETTSDVDRLTNLPESLKLQILSKLNVKQAGQTSTLSKSWGSLWTQIPVLNLNSDADSKKLPDFDKLVNRVLSLRDTSAKLEKLSFIRENICSAKILKTVCNYAVSNGVKELDICISKSRSGSWPDCLKSSSNSFTSLTLKSYKNVISCPFLPPISGSFNNLKVLYLKRPIIANLDAFSGFPFLEKLSLINCEVKTEGNTLNIHANQLLELKITCFKSFDRCEIIAPKLKSFKFRVYGLPLLKAPHGLPVLDTFDFRLEGDVSYFKDKKQTFEDLISMFKAVCNVKSLAISQSIFKIWSLFPDELVNRCSPFRANLKRLMVDLKSNWYHCDDDQVCCDGMHKWSSRPVETPTCVRAYLLKCSPELKFSMVFCECLKCNIG